MRSQPRPGLLASLCRRAAEGGPIDEGPTKLGEEVHQADGGGAIAEHLVQTIEPDPEGFVPRRREAQKPRDRNSIETYGGDVHRSRRDDQPRSLETPANGRPQRLVPGISESSSGNLHINHG
jgi:hypothetical protein